MVKKLFIGVLAFFLLCPAVFASVAIQDEGTNQGVATTLNIVGSNIATTDDGSTFTLTIADKVRSMMLPLTGFVTTTGASTIAPLSATTTPGLELDNLLPCIVWADSEATPAMITFRVPDDYLSGGAFRLLCDSSSSSTPVQVDFSVYVNTVTSVSWDAAATDQTAVALSSSAASPCMVTLTPATDFASLDSGHCVTLRVWRDDVSDGDGDLEVSYIEFYYTGN